MFPVISMVGKLTRTDITCVEFVTGVNPTMSEMLTQGLKISA